MRTSQNFGRESLGEEYWRSLENFMETFLDWDVLPVNIPDFPTVRRMKFGMNSPVMVPSTHARESVDRQQKVFTHGSDPLFIGYLVAVYFHTREIKRNS